VPVTRDGSIEEYQVHIAMHPAHHELESNFNSIMLLLVLFFVVIVIMILLLPWHAAKM